MVTVCYTCKVPDEKRWLCCFVFLQTKIHNKETVNDTQLVAELLLNNAALNSVEKWLKVVLNAGCFLYSFIPYKAPLFPNTYLQSMFTSAVLHDLQRFSNLSELQRRVLRAAKWKTCAVNLIAGSRERGHDLPGAVCIYGYIEHGPEACMHSCFPSR